MVELRCFLIKKNINSYCSITLAFSKELCSFTPKVRERRLGCNRFPEPASESMRIGFAALPGLVKLATLLRTASSDIPLSTWKLRPCWRYTATASPASTRRAAGERVKLLLQFSTDLRTKLWRRTLHRRGCWTLPKSRISSFPPRVEWLAHSWVIAPDFPPFQELALSMK